MNSVQKSIMDIGLLKEIPQDIFMDLEQIDSGSFSDIFTATHIKTKTKVVLKVSIKSNGIDFLEKEANIHKCLHHPFICKYFSNFETEHLFIIVMELVEGTNLLNLVNKHKGLPIQEAQNIFAQLIIVIEYLQEMNISHRDLKLENILIDKYGHISMIDFGFSSLNAMMSTCCGSVPYCAPEILSGKTYTNSADIWSLGIILFALLQGYLPFFHKNINVLALIICHNEVYFPSSMDLIACDLIGKMLVKDPAKRISIDEIKNHPFIKQNKLFRIDYKKLFSPMSRENALTGNLPLICVPKKTHNSLNMTKNVFNLSKRRYQRNMFYMKLRYHSTNEIATKHIETDLQEQITAQSDNVDDTILRRNDFALNLNKLIEMAYIKL